MRVRRGGVLFFDRGDFLPRLRELRAEFRLVGKQRGELRVLLRELRGELE